MMTPTLLGFGMLWFGAFVFLFAVLRAEARADRERRRATARLEHALGGERGLTARVRVRA